MESPEQESSHADFYQLLELPRHATLDDIKQQYRKLSLLYHPDKKTGDQEKYTQINLAYRVLSNDKKRKKYDNALASTFDELTQVKRDLEYHRNEEFLCQDEQGTQVFNEAKFAQVFQDRHTTLDQEFEATSESIEDLLNKKLAERDNLLEQIHSYGAVSELRKPETFNQVFDDLRKHNKELIADDTTLENNIENSLDQNLMTVGSTLDLSDISFQTQVIAESLKRQPQMNTDEDWKSKTPEELLQERMRAYQDETQSFARFKAKDFEIQVDPNVLSYLEAESESQQ
jgi:curved DNA-binding protein CbpA